MKLKLNTIHVKNLKESVKFYESLLGMKTIKKFTSRPGTTIAFLKGKTECILELIESEEESHDKNSKSNISIGFIVDNMDKIVNKLKSKNIEITQGPMEVSENTKLAFIKDPNGVDIEFIENLDL